MIPIVPWQPGASPEALQRLRRRFDGPPPEVTRRALSVIRGVQERGLTALEEARAAAGDEGPLRIPREALGEYTGGLGMPMLAALERLADHLRRYHARPAPAAHRYDDGKGGVVIERVRPLDCVGVLVPGHAMASATAVLMGAVPAALAGVEQIVATVSRQALERSPVLAAALQIAGIDQVFALEGAAAVAAMAFGVGPVPAVDLIVGGGGHETVAAKRLVIGRVGIDRFSGPPELVVVADGSGLASWVAADLIAVAERDPGAVPVAIVEHEWFARDVVAQLTEQLAAAPDRAVAGQALARHGAVFVAGSAEAAVRLLDLLAPEQASLQVGHPEAMAEQVRHVGAVLIGPYAPEAVRYLAGVNHVLPTAGTARFASTPGPSEFFKRSVEIHWSAARLASTADDIARLSRAEGFELSARAANARKELTAED